MADSKENATKPRNSSLMLCHYLTPTTILIRTEKPKKEKLFQDLIFDLARVWEIPEAEKLSEALWTREKEGHTVLESGLAIPHARVSGINEIKACLGIVPEGYLDPQENILVRIVFLFFSPQEQFSDHLQMLAQISRIFQDTKFLEHLISSKTPQEAFNLIQREERI